MLVCQSLQGGCTRKASHQSAGISHETFLEWLRRYPEFLEVVTRAEADAENLMVAAVHKAATDGDWRAAESWLKRRRRDDWGDNERVTHGGSLEFIATAAASADAKFDTILARSRPADLLDDPDAS